MIRQWWNNPRTAPWLTLGVIITGGVIAGIGTYIRDSTGDQNDQWTFLLDTIGLLIAFVGAGLDFRASGRISDLVPGSGRRRAAVEVLVGLVAGLGSCIALGWLATDGQPAILRGTLSAAMTAGIGIGFAGLLHIGWFSGSERLGRRIEQRVDEEW